MDKSVAERIVRRFIALPVEKRRQLLQQMQAAGQDFSLLPIAPSQDLLDRIPLSYAQQRLLFLWQLEPDNPFYNVPTALRLHGPIDTAAFAQALDLLVERHEALRTHFVADDEGFSQAIQAHNPTPLIIESSPELADAPVEQVLAVVTEELRKPFDLLNGPLLRVKLLKLGETEHVLCMCMHHIISDGWSGSLMVKEFVQLYNDLLAGNPTALEPLSIQYADYAIWQRSWLEAGEADRQLAYWKTQLGEEQPVLQLPFDHPRRPTPSYQGAQVITHIDAQTATQLKQHAQQNGYTLFMLMLAALALVLSRYSGQNDIRIGAPNAGRNRKELENLIGFFINTQVLRVQIDEPQTLPELLEQVRTTVAGAQAHQELPFESLVDALLPERNLALNPLFQVKINQSIDHSLIASGEATTLGSLTISELPINSHDARFDLAFDFSNTDSGIHAAFTYATDLFEAATVERLARSLQSVLRSFIGNPQTRLVDIQEASPPSQPFNPQTFPASGFLGLWQQTAALHPERIAVATADQQLRYAELERASNQLARHLQAQGIGTGAVVALCMERSPDWVISLLAVLKLGAIYLPLDNQQPVERLQQLLHDSNTALLILPVADTALATATQCPSLAYQPEQWADKSDAALATVIEPQQPAYIIYTSGSTGQPKGVVVSHSALANYLQAVLQRLDLSENASLALVSTIAADLGHTMLFGALASGRSLHLLSHDHAFDPDRFAQYMAEQHIDALKIVPSHLQALLQAGKAADVLPAKVLILGGEVCPWTLVEKVRGLKPECRIINHYGPTETTVGVLTHEVSEQLQDSHSVPVGLPLANVSAELLDAYLNPVPQRVAGDLYLGGATLALGYIGQAAATAERFIPAVGGGRLYRTGDRARLSKDQLLEFIGRTDDQVKIRGYRVEPGEVGRVLASLPGVQDAVVLALPLNRDATRLQLVGYAVADSSTGSEALQQAMKQRLPDYLVPTQVMVLERLPLTANGKLDKRALPKPGAIKQAYVAPGNEIERILAAVWADVLKLKQVGTTDNFFELGGDSILSLQIIARAKRQSLKLTPKQVFEQQTIGQLAKVAKVIEAKPQAAVPVSEAKKRSPLIVLSPEQLANLPIPAEEIEDIYPLSPMQQGMLFHTLLDTEAGHYINQMRVDVQGLDVERFKAAWHAAISRHEVLRANFVTVETPLQVIRKRIDAPCTLLDWRTETQLSQKLDALALEDRRKGFDLASDPMLRLTLIRTADNTHHLIHTTHHILLDGWSNSQLMGEILQNYAGIAPAPVTSQYRDYIEWLGEQDASASEAFWKEQLVELDGPTRLAKAIRQPDLQSESRYGYQQVVFDKQQTETLNNFAQSQRVTLNTLVQAAWLILLQHYTGQDSVACGVTVSGRPTDLDGVEQQLGLFINTLPLATRPLPEQSVGQWLQALQAQNLALREHEYTPLYEVQRWAGSSGEALFDTLLVFENYPISQALEQGVSHGLTFSGLSGEGQTNYELTIAAEVSGTLSVNFIYSRTAFNDRTIESLAAGFERLLLAMSDNANVALGELALLSSEELRQVIRDWNRTEASYPVDQCIHQLIEQQVAKTPEATALVFSDQSLSYSELNQRANQLAHKLRELGVGPDVLVGIAVERSLEMVTGLLAILKAGGAYVPLDPEYPQERLAYMMEDSGIRLLLTQSHLQDQLPTPNHVQTLSLDRGQESLAGYSDANLDNITQPDNLAYVIYTSGSTGKPKGTLLPHHNVTRLFQATQDWYQFDGNDVWSVFHSYAFDFSVWELFGALLYGGKAVIVPKEVARSPEDFHTLLLREKVTVLNQTPSAFKQLIPIAVDKARPLSLRYIIFGGEALDVGSLALWFNTFGDGQPQLVNMYGITETTVHVSHRLLTADDLHQDVSSPLGSAIPDLSWYVLDGAGQPVSKGCHGELHVGRAGLARGYLNHPALTAERFIPDPLDTREQGGGRLYRTGDLARYHNDGVIEYAGRIDHQVKIRGFRIELGEIEFHLQKHDSVRNAVVIDIDGPGGQQLVAYLVADTDLSSDAEQQAALRTALRDYLKETLPDYMVPAHLIFLEQLPLTPNGKLDRKELPKPDASQLQREYVAPQSELEKQIAAIWADVLKVEKVGLTDHFFELGGHSLLVISVLSRLQISLGQKIAPALLFQHPTLAAFCQSLDTESASVFEAKLQRLDLFAEELEEIE